LTAKPDRGILQSMRALLLSILLASSLISQTTFSVSGPATVKAGKAATITISVKGSAGIVVSQWAVVAPENATIGAPASSFPSIACGPSICLLQGALTDGPIATISVHFPKNAPLGKVSISLSGLVASDVNGLCVDGLVVGPALWIKVTAP
jgi:hypothetical protein